MTSLTIAHVYNYMHPHYGGPPNVIIHIIREQLKRGMTVFLMASDLADPEVQATLPFDPRLILIEIKPKWIRSLLSRKKMDWVLGQVDLVHFHSIWPTPCLTISARCRSLHVPYILSLHGHLRSEAINLKKWKKKIGLLLGYRGFIQGASIIHALNPSEKDDALRFGLTQPIHVIPNGISPHNYPLCAQIKASSLHHNTPSHQRSSSTQIHAQASLSSLHPLPLSRGIIEQKWPVLKNRPYILFLSRLHHRKGIFDLLHAFAHIHQDYPEYLLVLAGGDHGSLHHIHTLLDQYQLHSKVLLTGFVFGDLKSALLTHATLFTLPSEHEGFSIAILEALAYARPTLISTGCHFNQLAKEEAGWVYPTGLSGLKKALVEILDHPESRDQRGRFAQKWVFQSFDWVHIVNQYTTLYHSLTSKN